MCGSDHPACENYWYCTYCSAMEIVYEVDIVPWCERIGKKEFGGNVDKCKKKKHSKDHWECHKDCFA